MNIHKCLMPMKFEESENLKSLPTCYQQADYSNSSFCQVLSGFSVSLDLSEEKAFQYWIYFYH